MVLKLIRQVEERIAENNAITCHAIKIVTHTACRCGGNPTHHFNGTLPMYTERYKNCTEAHDVCKIKRKLQKWSSILSVPRPEYQMAYQLMRTKTNDDCVFSIFEYI